MDKLSTIQQPIQKELESLNMTIRAALQTDSDLMNSVVDYYLGVKGKQIRPLLVMLSASLCGSINESTINAAAGIELLHNMGFKTAAMALTDNSVSIDDKNVKSEEKLAIILGTEGEGLHQNTINSSDYTIKIPMSHGVDSLNVAAASAVAFWKLGK